MKKTLLLFTLTCITLASFAQKTALCGADEVNKRLMEQNPDFRKKQEAFEKRWQEFNTTRGKQNILGTDTTYDIPIVIHVIHTGGAVGTNYNPADSQLVNWVSYVNQVYAAQYAPYPDSSSGGTYFPYRFVLAKRDPSCNATTGIVRVDGSVIPDYATYGVQYNGSLGATEDDLRTLSHWPQNNYYNIYVVNKFDSIDPYLPFPGSSYLAGFAYFPGAGISDGAYMLAYSAHSGSSVMPHEMGHAMGLMHTFQGGNASICPPNSNCLVDGDKVCDTEPVKNLLSVSPCLTNSDFNSCTGSNYDNGQKNIMGYGGCLNRFTPGQRDRALLYLLYLRTGLATSVATLPPGLSVTSASCTPSIVNAGNTFGMGPCYVWLNTLNYTSGGYSDDDFQEYIDNSCSQQTVLHPTTSYTIEVSTEVNIQKVRAYIDFNNNGIFTAGELVLDHVGTTASEVHSATFTPPVGAVLDVPLRMRVVSDWVSSTTPTSCSALSYGQAEDFAVFISTSNPLPVKLLSFTAQAKERTIQLNWKTATELMLDRFELERSTDGDHFSLVTKLSAQGKASSYTYDDKDVISGKVYYYRLRSIDADGKFSYSSIVTVKLSGSMQTNLKVYPNPASGNELAYTFDAFAGATELRIVDLTGKMLVKKQVKDLQGTLDISKLQDGIYMLQICAGDNVLDVQKVWVQK